MKNLGQMHENMSPHLDRRTMDRISDDTPNEKTYSDHTAQ